MVASQDWPTVDVAQVRSEEGRVVVCWNANGVRGRIKDGTLRAFLAANRNAEVIGLTELEATAKILNGVPEWRDLLTEFGWQY